MASLSTPLTESQEKLFAETDVKYENLDLKLTPKNQDLEAQDLEEQIQQAAIDQNQSFSSEVIASIKSNFLTYLFNPIITILLSFLDNFLLRSLFSSSLLHLLSLC